MAGCDCVRTVSNILITLRSIEDSLEGLEKVTTRAAIDAEVKHLRDQLKFAKGLLMDDFPEYCKIRPAEHNLSEAMREINRAIDKIDLLKTRITISKADIEEIKEKIDEIFKSFDSLYCQ